MHEAHASVCESVCGCVHVCWYKVMPMCRSENNLMEWLFSFHHLCLRTQTHVIGSASKQFDPQSHLPGLKMIRTPETNGRDCRRTEFPINDIRPPSPALVRTQPSSFLSLFGASSGGFDHLGRAVVKVSNLNPQRESEITFRAGLSVSHWTAYVPRIRTCAHSIVLKLQNLPTTHFLQTEACIHK